MPNFASTCSPKFMVQILVGTLFPTHCANWLWLETLPLWQHSERSCLCNEHRRSLNVNTLWGIFLMSVLPNLDMLHTLHRSTDLVSSRYSPFSDQATPLATSPSKGDLWITWQMYTSAIYNLESWKWNLRVLLLSVKNILLISVFFCFLSAGIKPSN